MNHLLEYNSFYNKDNIVLIEYWYNNMLTPVKIVERLTTKKVKVTHNITQSKIHNAPDEIIKTSDIIDKYRL